MRISRTSVIPEAMLTPAPNYAWDNAGIEQPKARKREWNEFITVGFYFNKVGYLRRMDDTGWNMGWSRRTVNTLHFKWKAQN